MGSATVQGRLWSQKARAWSELQEKMHQSLYEGALGALGPLRGKDLLDAGCGSGMFLEVAAKAGAAVSGVDAAPALIDVAKERTPGVDLRVADVEELPFNSDVFDIVTAFNSIQYAADPINAMRELARVCRTAGRVLIGQWADPSRCETEALFVRLRQLAPPPPGTPAPLALSGAGQLEARMVDAGIRPVGWGEALAPFEYPDLETAWLAMASAGPLVRVIEVAGEAEVREVVEDVFRSAVRADGSVRHENVFRWVLAEPA